MASTLASLCLSQRWTFWTYVVTINLFSLYLMNFTLHTMLDATGVVLKVHYKVWNVMFYFHKVAYVQYLGEVDIFHTWVKTFLPLYNSAKIIKIDRVFFPKLWPQMYCHLFMVHSVDDELRNWWKFGSHSHLDPDPGIFTGFFNIARDREYFRNLAHISEQTDRTFMKI